jgi:prophage regulatory protein
MSNLIPYERLNSKGITYSKTHTWRLEKFHKQVDAGEKKKTSAPLFPLRVPIGPAKYGYVEEEIDAYVAELIANRDAGVDPGIRKPGPKRPAPSPEPIGRASAASAPLHEPDKPLPDNPRKKRPAPTAAEAV